ncbi:MAG: GNAT family N-acetyltransferase [Actinobacteria bacterium]|nr:GNAT family N-acetyltransferase [Actinomycetota bacterium]
MTITYRPLRDVDYDALAALLNAADIADGRAQCRVAEEIREEFESHPVDLADHTLAAWIDDQLAAAVYAYYLPSEVREVRCYVFGAVYPKHRGNGIGSRLLGWGVEKAEHLLRSSASDIPKYVRVETSRTNTAAIRLFERGGMQPIRYFADLHADLRSPTPPLRASAGFRIVPWDLARNEEARLVRNAAFMDHWGSTPTLPEWWSPQITGFGARPDWSYFAVNDDDAIVGYVLSHRFENDDELLGAKYAWVNNIGTLVEWRGMGVASQLIATALARYRAEGMQFAALGVDSANPTGAYRLYESLGFRLWREFVTYQRVVSAY